MNSLMKSMEVVGMEGVEPPCHAGERVGQLEVVGEQNVSLGFGRTIDSSKVHQDHFHIYLSH